MDISMGAGGLANRLRLMIMGLALAMLATGLAQAAPVVVSVDHRVTVSYSRLQFDSMKGAYKTQARITNNSGGTLLAPLQLSFDTAVLSNVRIANAHGVGKDGRPYFEFKLRKGKLVPKAGTEPVTIIVVPDKGRNAGVVAGGVSIKQLAAAQQVSAGVDVAPLSPRAEPYALQAGTGRTNVRFSVRLAGKVKPDATVYLRPVGARSMYSMNDVGKEGDLVAGDGIYGVNVPVDANKLKPDSCQGYEAVMRLGKAEAVSSPCELCVSEYPVRLKESNPTHTIELPGGGKAVADELLLTVVPNTKASVIRQMAAQHNLVVSGYIPALNLYQLRLSAPVNANRLLALIEKLKGYSAVRSVSVNAIGGFAYTPTDPEFASQHGLQLVRADDVWDIGATGTGNTITILDSGLERTHPDFGVSGDCQLSTDATAGVANSDCGGTNNDAVGHGTQVAGVVGAKTNNAMGVAGVAHDGKLHSIQASADSVVTLAEMTQGFTDAASYGLASVVNASFSGGPWAFVDVTALCTSMNSVVLSGVTPIAVIANAAGNDGLAGYFYPGRCNDNSRPQHAGLTRKDLLFVVANSTSIVDAACGSVPLDQRCSTSNYGAWVDIAAPGSVIRTTAAGGGYISSTGTSLAAPMVSGAAAILRSCGVALDQIEPTLRMTTNPAGKVNVTFPDASSAPRLDIHLALQAINHAPTGVSPALSSVNEGSGSGTLVATLSAVDIDVCDKKTYSIIGANPGGFVLDANTGALTVGAVVMDYEALPPPHFYSLTVRATDFFGATFDQAITVNVNNLNDNAPVITSNGGGASAAVSVPENTTAVTTVTATDADVLGALSYSIVPGGDAGSFGIDPLTGALSFVVAPNFEMPSDSGGNNIFDVTVQASDGTNTDTQAIAVTVTNASEAPTGNPAILPPDMAGNRTVGQLLTADLTPIYNPDAWPVVEYRWKREGTSLGVNAPSYTLVAGDIGGHMSVCVLYADMVERCSTQDSTAVGDPHITTVDGLHYDFQGAGEFVALRGAGGMEVQLRMAAVSTAPPLPDSYTGLTSGVSVNTAVAAHVGQRRVTYQPDPAVAGAFLLRVDGVVTALPAEGIDLGDGGRVVPQASGGIQIDFPDHTTLMVNTSSWPFYGAHWLHVSVFHTSAYEGIMGARKNGSWLPRLSNGSAFGTKPVSLHDRYVQLYETFADSWRVTDKTSLFDYSEGDSTATFTNRKWPTENGPYDMAGAPVAKPLDKKAAELACRDVVGKNEKADCVFDVRVMGNGKLARGHRLNQKIRLGAVNVLVRTADKLNARRELLVTAKVVRHATVVPKVKGIRTVPAGSVQFMLGGKALGKPVRLDAKGQATLAVSRKDIERFKAGKQAVTAQYLPAKNKANVFLPAISKRLTPDLLPAALRAGDIR